MRKLFLFAAVTLSFCFTALAQDKPLKIIEQPRPELPASYRTLDAQGTQTLRVEFNEGGFVGEIVPENNLPGGLTERAIAAARRIRFEPEVKNGKPVTVFKQLQYFYSWNGGWRVPELNPDKGPPSDPQTEKAEAIIKKAVGIMGGDRYLSVNSQIGRGKYTGIRDGIVVSYQTFLDVIVFPDKERTDFKNGGVKTIQVNLGDTGWTYEGQNEMVKDQTAEQVSNFKRGLRVSLDNLLRGGWRKEASLSYVGRRPSTLGKRNDVIRLNYNDGYVVEFEFTTDEGLPAKSIYFRKNINDEEIKEEDRYAQFIEVDGIKAPFIIDRWSGNTQSSRINYDSIEYNKRIPESIFAKPGSAKEAKKDLKL